ncbi:putative oxidoreductase GLYR1 isoform X1 [Morone saxatilis]|uniref:putative oxidoreductase GLYR1 isoform X1 n=1 Tax=Morone saxatilis TaxID=34816 RepID=UPI0015E219DC|nr:putative oxidoreductase GLYR1 isoform X1 [Morone saxatilis]
MATVHLRIGDLVWGKLGRYPPWPGKVVSPPKDLKKPRGKKCHFVKFFGTEDHAWIKVEQLKPYHAHKEEMIKINKGKRFQQAVDAVEDFLKKAKGKEQNSDGKGESKGKKTPNKPLKILEEDDEDLSALKDPSEKDLTDSDPEPSTIERLGAGPGSGFKWESSPVKDDPHFHHFLLSQSEKVSRSMLLNILRSVLIISYLFSNGFEFVMSDLVK